MDLRKRNADPKERKLRMRRTLKHKCIKGLLILICLVCCIAYGYQMYQYREGEAIYSEAEQLAELPELPENREPSSEGETAGSEDKVTEPEQEPVPEPYVDPYAEALRAMDFRALREVNDEVLGWILIPQTRLSYPVVQGDDNKYYLDRTWKKTRNSVGAIFMECTNSRDLSDFHTIIYGHRMNNRSMFGILLNYDDEAYYQKHPTVYLTDDNGTRAYEIFAAYEVGVTEPTYRLGLDTPELRTAFLEYCTKQSVIETGVIPDIDDQILTLSTCTGDGHDTRWVVQAVLKHEEPEAEQEETVAEPEVQPEMPSEIQIEEETADAQ